MVPLFLFTSLLLILIAFTVLFEEESYINQDCAYQMHLFYVKINKADSKITVYSYNFL